MAKICYEEISFNNKRLEKIDLVNIILDDYDSQDYQLTGIRFNATILLPIQPS